MHKSWSVSSQRPPGDNHSLVAAASHAVDESLEHCLVQSIPVLLKGVLELSQTVAGEAGLQSPAGACTSSIQWDLVPGI
ncbi:hypothetical protein ACOMHN_018957 [Nucella lapillus]